MTHSVEMPPFHCASFVPWQELNSSLVDRDRAICERNELLEKYCHEVKDKAEAQKELSQACKDIEMVREERDVARKERTEAIIQRDQLLREYYQARQVTKHIATEIWQYRVKGCTHDKELNAFSELSVGGLQFVRGLTLERISVTPLSAH